jgi:hypothetical protein
MSIGEIGGVAFLVVVATAAIAFFLHVNAPVR